MPSNDTENIYSTQYGGEGEPIPATKISYDGTGTSIEATDVQGAITEVDTDLQSTKGDVDDIKTAIVGTKLFVTNDAIGVTADGVKSYGNLLTELHTAVRALIAALEDDTFLVEKYLYIEGALGLNAIYSTGHKNTDESVAMAFERSQVTTTACANANVQLTATPTYNIATMTSTSTAVASKLTDVPTSGNKIHFHYQIWKQV